MTTIVRLWRGKLHLLEPLRYQLVDIPRRLHRAMWLENCDIDLDYHVRRLQIRPPGGHRELDAAIGAIASTALDRSKPLWEFHFVEGMADNRFAIIGKVHHALADGVASANLMARALDFPDASWPDKDSYRCDPLPSDGQLIRAAMRDHAGQLRELPGLLQDTVKGIRRVRRNSRSAPGLARNFRPPATFLNHVVTPGRTFASATLPLADVKSTGKRLGATINDMVLAISTGALRALLLKYDGHADEPLLCGVPMSIDTSPERISGNALGTVVVSLPVQVADPLEWVRLAHTGATIGKENAQLLGSELVSRWSNYAPPDLDGVGFSPHRNQPLGQQADQRSRLQRAGPAPVRPGRGRPTHRDLLGRAAHLRGGSQYHRVELCRPTQNLGARRRCDLRRPPRGHRRYGRRVFAHSSRGRHACRGHIGSVASRPSTNTLSGTAASRPAGTARLLAAIRSSALVAEVTDHPCARSQSTTSVRSPS